MPSTRDGSQPNEADILVLNYSSIGGLPAFDSLAKLKSYIQLPKPTQPCTSSMLEESVTTPHPSSNPTRPSLGRDASLLEQVPSGSLFDDHHDTESDSESSPTPHSKSSTSSRSSSPFSFVISSDFGMSRFSSPNTTGTESSDGLSSAVDDCASDMTNEDSGPLALIQGASHDTQSPDSSPISSRASTPRSKRPKKDRNIESRAARRKPSCRSRRVACALCRQTFSREADRDRHLASVHKDPAGPQEFLGRHPCRFCGKGFSRPDAKARHESARSVDCRRVGRQIKEERLASGLLP
ncbi:hypothetical protein PM082_022580 [Marasmius tenuissimus]|nr:hypothetical protein PM082_022580 [Marasmius tenuissimus]